MPLLADLSGTVVDDGGQAGRRREGLVHAEELAGRPARHRRQGRVHGRSGVPIGKTHRRQADDRRAGVEVKVEVDGKKPGKATIAHVAEGHEHRAADHARAGAAAGSAAWCRALAAGWQAGRGRDDHGRRRATRHATGGGRHVRRSTSRRVSTRSRSSRSGLKDQELDVTIDPNGVAIKEYRSPEVTGLRRVARGPACSLVASLAGCKRSRRDRRAEKADGPVERQEGDRRVGAARRSARSTSSAMPRARPMAARELKLAGGRRESRWTRTRAALRRRQGWQREDRRRARRDRAARRRQLRPRRRRREGQATTARSASPRRARAEPIELPSVRAQFTASTARRSISRSASVRARRSGRSRWSRMPASTRPCVDAAAADARGTSVAGGAAGRDHRQEGRDARARRDEVGAAAGGRRSSLQRARSFGSAPARTAKLVANGVDARDGRRLAHAIADDLDLRPRARQRPRDRAGRAAGQGRRPRWRGDARGRRRRARPRPRSTSTRAARPRSRWCAAAASSTAPAVPRST